MYTALAQFEVISIFSTEFSSYAFYVTNVAVSTLVIGIIMSFFFSKVWNTEENAYQWSVEQSVQLIKVVLKQNLSIPKQYYYSNYYFLFIFILVSNLMGLVPYAFTITSSFIITLFLSLSHYIGINLLGIFLYRWTLVKLLLPSGVPAFITPILIIIELISYLAKIFSLSIRLFANMMSGHALLKILTTFVVALLQAGMFMFLAPIPWIAVTVILGLEFLIGCLQAYVFTVLTAIYHNDALHHH